VGQIPHGALMAWSVGVITRSPPAALAVYDPMDGFIEVLPGVRSRVSYCDGRVIVVETLLDPGAEVPRHSHESTQVTVVLDGELDLWIEGAGWSRLARGQYRVIPPSTPHSARAGGGGALVLDVNSPVTEDRRRLAEKLGATC